MVRRPPPHEAVCLVTLYFGNFKLIDTYTRTLLARNDNGPRPPDKITLSRTNRLLEFASRCWTRRRSVSALATTVRAGHSSRRCGAIDPVSDVDSQWSGAEAPGTALVPGCGSSQRNP